MRSLAGGFVCVDMCRFAHFNDYLLKHFNKSLFRPILLFINPHFANVSYFHSKLTCT